MTYSLLNEKLNRSGKAIGRNRKPLTAHYSVRGVSAIKPGRRLRLYLAVRRID